MKSRPIEPGCLCEKSEPFRRSYGCTAGLITLPEVTCLSDTGDFVDA